MNDPVTVLARKWCLIHSRRPRWSGELCECARIVAAVREALEEQLKRLEATEHTCMDSCCRDDAIAALRALKSTA